MEKNIVDIFASNAILPRGKDFCFCSCTISRALKLKKTYFSEN
jgi:hypothetical protein